MWQDKRLWTNSKRIEKIDTDSIIDSGYIEAFIETPVFFV